MPCPQLKPPKSLFAVTIGSSMLKLRDEVRGGSFTTPVTVYIFPSDSNDWPKALILLKNFSAVLWVSTIVWGWFSAVFGFPAVRSKENIVKNVLST